MQLNLSPTELTTAATNVALAVLCLVLLVLLLRRPGGARWKKSIWASVFALLASASALGAIAHGFDLPSSVKTALWRPLYLLLGLSVALFLVGGIGDWRGERAARTVLPWVVAAGVGFFALTQVADSFGVFIAYEGVAMVATLGIYLFLWAARGVPGAGAVASGIVITLVAAALQVSSLSARIIWDFDHNGLFHLVQTVAILVVARGLRLGMTRASSPTAPAAG